MDQKVEVFKFSISLFLIFKKLKKKGPTSSIACYADKILWQDQIQGRATILTGNINFIAFTCQGGYLYIYSRVGRRVKKILSIKLFNFFFKIVKLFPCITLESSLAYLECSDKDYLLAISITGKVYVW